MRVDRMTPEELEARADEIVAAELAAQGIVPGNASPALLAKTVRLLRGPKPAKTEEVAS